ncbi:hypothetical protein [Rhodobacter calidifons]|uniref:Roadblock/LAMTOR2 domain-containing protein n=1 Tax=Rhodobacter calidifons TaxID=2715277 RepID=A0ABX0G4X2_9RHOB|nr:hypothetical protein [Rhodobacter calidifons]NHB75918.1 hypothetical protein [Rhodobacter calidifons]
MNKGAVPILARLHSLQAPVRILSGGARVIAEAGSPNPVAQILRAVNETMLARSLEFRSSAGSSLTLDVDGRRVLRLTASHGLPGAEACLGAEVLEDEHKDDLIKLMQALAGPRPEIRVVTGPVSRDGAEVSVGLPVALLADLLLIDLNPVGPDAPDAEAEAVPASEDPPTVRLSGASIEVFAQAIGPSLIAWLIRGGAGDAARAGPEDMVSHLQGFLDEEADAVIRQLDLVSAAPGDPACLLLGVTLIEGHSILCARLEDRLLLGVIEGDGAQAVLTAWRGLLA